MKRDGTAKARALRRNLTDAERLLWRHLRSRQLEGAKFRRQFPVGSFVADFVCLEARLVVELDGGQHAFQAARDKARTHFLLARGFRVIRFWNHEVLGNIGGVLQQIAAELRG
ncbi:endonuclease domain-containing protein [Tepidicaulis sp.]|uniref:endonuclease domain-containing protein n=1 Tax=Tepidicaulis sp. TaxID=1920809 RepID=UPI003B5C7A73